MATKFLNGVRVLDLSRVLAGPWAAQTLGDFGAEIIKVEQPGKGDDSRSYGPPFLKDASGSDSAESAFYLSANRNKQSIAIDFSKPEGAELVRSIASQSDVLIENFKVGTLSRYGLDYETIQKANPRIIYCSITGFGQTGPYREQPGYDSVFQAMSGLMAVTGYPDGAPGGGPMKVGPSITDIIGGTTAVGAILAALYGRDAMGGNGQHIDLAMLDVTIAAMSHHAMYYLVSGQQPPRRGTEGHGGAGGKMYRCKNGAVILTIGNDTQFERFCRAIRMGHLASDERYKTHKGRTINAAKLFAEVEPVISEMTADDFLRSLKRNGIAAGPVYEFDGVFSDAQVESRELVQQVEHPLGALRILRNPVRFSDSLEDGNQAPPTLGQHTEDILKNVLRLDEAEIVRLRSSGVLSATRD